MRICAEFLIIASLMQLFVVVHPAIAGMGRRSGSNSLQKRESESRTFLADILGLSTLKLIPFFFISLFFLIPIGLFFSALLLIQIPVLTSPVAGIAAAVGRRHNSEDAVEQLFHDFSNSGECIQRISCEIGRSITSTEIRGIVDQSLNDMAPFLKDKWKGTIPGYVFGSNGRLSPVNNCGKYACKVGNTAETPATEDWNF